MTTNNSGFAVCRVSTKFYGSSHDIGLIHRKRGKKK